MGKFVYKVPRPRKQMGLKDGQHLFPGMHFGHGLEHRLYLRWVMGIIIYIDKIVPFYLIRKTSLHPFKGSQRIGERLWSDTDLHRHGKGYQSVEQVMVSRLMEPHSLDRSFRGPYIK